VLSDRNQNWFIHEWLMGRHSGPDWCVLHARTREDIHLAHAISLRDSIPA
jgi:hypothetical protein